MLVYCITRSLHQELDGAGALNGVPRHWRRVGEVFEYASSLRTIRSRTGGEQLAAQPSAP